MSGKTCRIKYDSRRKGFTLLELLVVIAIIAILAVVAIPTLVDVLGNSKTKVDLSNCALLNRMTKIYRADIQPPDPFLDTANSDEDLMNVLIAKGALSELIVPTASDASFEWDFDVLGWAYFVEGELVGDPLIENFIASIGTSSITYDAFISKDTRWASASAYYSPTSWNGYLEMILEAGNIAPDKSGKYKRDATKEGSNTIGYENPYSGKGTVVNYDKWLTIQGNYPEKIPPAILITNQSDFAPDKISEMIIKNKDYLKGTMVIYKLKTTNLPNTPNDQTVVYYILEDGSKSKTYSIDEILN
ncbi:MAG: type II secretion system protein [Clostridia bacterium]|nr:type II secretion system protein [Clostridia bacterium]